MLFSALLLTGLLAASSAQINSWADFQAQVEQTFKAPCWNACVLKSTICVTKYLACLYKGRDERCRDRTLTCEQPKNVGNRCAYEHKREPRKAWYYDYKLQQCVEFNFLGCDGNGNVWDTEADCQAACGKYYCYQALDIGRSWCSYSETNFQGQRAYFSTVTNKCESFFYFGCGGNLNRFASISACKAACQ